jgi:hypothetical protein
MLFPGQVIERVCVSVDDDRGGHAWESVGVTSKPCVGVHCLAKDVRQREL